MGFLQSNGRKLGHRFGDDVGRKVLRFLHDHELTATPAHYELIYHYVTSPDDLRAKAIDAAIMGGAPLDPALMAQLHATHGADSTPPNPERDALSADRSELSHQARHLAEVTAGAQAANETFGSDLAADMRAMEHAPRSLIEQVSAMVERTQATEQELAGALEKVRILREQVETERGNAGRDALTGLLNRRGIQAALDSARPGDIIALVDVDRFKDVNDRHGHMVGDRVLKVIANSLSESCNPHPVARWGGEEFLILMPGLSMEQAADLIEQARISLRNRRLRLIGSGARIDGVSFSAGLAAFVGGFPEQSINAADRALYHAKESGRDRICRERKDGKTL